MFQRKRGSRIRDFRSQVDAENYCARSGLDFDVETSKIGEEVK